ncbi:MAG: M23 family metallopeptidase, partial [Prochlorococcaceae cyanobacterium]
MALALAPLPLLLGSLAWAEGPQAEGPQGAGPQAAAEAEPAPQAAPQPSLQASPNPSMQPLQQAAPAPAQPLRPPLGGANLPTPLRLQPSQVPAATPRRFDASLDALVNEGVVTPAERARVRGASALQPIGLGEQQRACRLGALSAEECRRGLAVRWRGRIEGNPFISELGGSSLGAGAAGAFERFGSGGQPLPPLTVPVSALLAGGGGSFRLGDVFRITPRPAPMLGNGNRRLLFPLIGSALTTSNFGWRLHPVLGNWLMHAGRDLAAPEGTPVVAALGGTVVSSGLAGGYGLAVEIEHGSPRRRTLYGHLSELFVKPGERVRQGEVIGRVGSTGLSTGPHLHFELRLPGDGGWVAVDPGELDPGGGPGGG